MFIPTEKKEDIIKTLEFYNVNTVRTYSKKEILLDAALYYHRYAIRSLVPNGCFFRNLSYNDVLYFFEKLKTPFIVCDDYTHFDKSHLLCNGEIELYKTSFNTYSYRGKINKSSSIQIREISYPSFDIPRQQIPKQVLDFIWKHYLLNTVVEFSLYSIPLGIKSSPLIIWEIRRY